MWPELSAEKQNKNKKQQPTVNFVLFISKFYSFFFVLSSPRGVSSQTYSTSTQLRSLESPTFCSTFLIRHGPWPRPHFVRDTPKLWWAYCNKKKYDIPPVPVPNRAESSEWRNSSEARKGGRPLSQWSQGSSESVSTDTARKDFKPFR